jgi:hypothetical protein
VKGLFAFHVPLGGYRRPIEAAILKSIGAVPGIPDLIIIHSGQCFGLELKADRGRLTDVQRVAHGRMRAAGACVAVAYGLDEALAQLADWRLLRPDASTQIGRAFEELRRGVAARTRRPSFVANNEQRKAQK